MGVTLASPISAIFYNKGGQASGGRKRPPAREFEVPRSCAGVIARRKRRSNLGEWGKPDRWMDCRAFSLPGSENGSQ